MDEVFDDRHDRRAGALQAGRRVRHHTWNRPRNLDPRHTSYGYDADGNLNSSATGGSFTYNAQNQTTAATWGGQTLSGMQFGGLGQTERTAAGSTTYASSPLGLQISKSGTSSTYFLRDGKGNLLGQRLPDGSHWYYLKDGLGSIVAVINGAGTTVANRYRYDPYGKVVQSSGTQANPWGYAGGYLDSTALIKFGTRYYDPNVGRWTQTDPAPGRLANPSSLDRYSYSSCNPVNWTDATGKCTADPLAAAGMALGSAFGLAGGAELTSTGFDLIGWAAGGELLGGLTGAGEIAGATALGIGLGGAAIAAIGVVGIAAGVYLAAKVSGVLC